MFTLNYPLKKRIITSPFGWRTKPKIGFHSGVDFACPVGTAIYPAHKGKIVFAGQRGNYGLAVILLHEGIGRVWTLYGHLSRCIQEIGETLAEDEIMAYSGNTGWSTGPHTHFECRIGVNGIIFAKDPMRYLKNGPTA